MGREAIAMRASDFNIESSRALVTGGGGFLGGAIVRQLLGQGIAVRSFARGEYPELAALGVEVVRGDLADEERVARACAGCDLVFHVAARPGVWGSHGEFFGPNVHGTKNVIAASHRHGISRLVYTSSPSVVFGGRDMEGVDESVPYPTRYHAHYPRTKAIAERMALKANSAKLSTVALRPHLIWGPGDNHLFPRLINRAREGSLKIVGDGTNKVDTIYVDNAAIAHLRAAATLAPDALQAGKAYFVSQGEPVVLSEMINRMLDAAGMAPVTKSVPAGVAYAAGAVLEAVHTVLRIKAEPRMTRFLARELSTSHWFDISAARRDFGYEPEVTTEEGLVRLAQWFAQSEARSDSGKEPEAARA